MDKGLLEEFPSVFSTSCKNDSCKDVDNCRARGIDGGRKGSVVDEHGGNVTEMEAEKICVGKGRTPRVEEDRDFDTVVNGIETSGASGNILMFRESEGVECVLLVGRGRSGERRKTTTDDDDDDDKQATATTTGLARLDPGLAIRGADVLVGSRQSPVDGMPEAEILASKTRGVPKKEMSGLASPLGERGPAGPASPPVAKSNGGRRGRGRSPSGQQGGDHRSGMIGGYVPRADACRIYSNGMPFPRPSTSDGEVGWVLPVWTLPLWPMSQVIRTR